ncbi:MAG: ATP-binding cassette domain-containing protein [Chloroflexota bacterium]|nr:ATP-binding cassette domain-containing protein [Chloroflexota bacterium]
MRADVAAVETIDLVRRFDDLVAVDSVSFAVSTGSVFGLLGPNGAGKTTTIKMLTTLLPPSAGTGRVNGYDILHEPVEVRRRIGYVPQALSADGLLTGRENLSVFAKLYSIPRSERRERIDDAFELMGLDDAADDLVKTYSGGMVRRLEIAQSMLHSPPVLFLDEPTVGLDPVARRVVWDHLRAVRETLGTTILLTTHYMEEAAELCDRVAIMHQGRVAAIGAPAELVTASGAADLDGAFAHYTGAELKEGGSYKDALRTRRTARRLA